MATKILAGNATNGLVLTPDNTGILEIKTGTGAGTTALTLDASQNTTVAGGLTVTGASTLTGGVAGNFKMNSGYGSAATAYGCRAWVNFDGTAAGTFAGGVSTVSRTAGSTTATVTTTTAHGLITGNVVSALTGVVAGSYVVTFISATQFSFTTVATTVLTAASITFAVSSIRASGNVGSVADNGVGDYTINFTTAMPDANYAANAFGTDGTGTFTTADAKQFEYRVATVNSLRLVYMRQYSPYTPTNPTVACIAIFR